MNRQQIKDAKAEAKRFITDCDAALDRLDDELEQNSWRTDGPQPGDHSSGSRQTGQLRRTSLDLTRALARMRRP